jgi:hypothetical protein
MALMSRLDLEALFKNGKKPSEKDFAHLIESMLNKRDDQFMGRWKAGKTYRTGDVVIANHGLWEVAEGFGDGLCSKEPPSKPDWQELIILESDGDWKAYKDEGIMYAQVYNLIGIGKEYDPENGEIPEARVDITDEDKSRYLIFPTGADTPALSLFQLEGGEESPEQEKTYFISGLNNDEVNFLSDTSAFVFRKGEYCEDGDEPSLKPTDGVVLMTIRSGNSGLAQIGISTPDPSAMLDITDRHRGQFLFNPEDKTDPSFSIINLDPDTDKNYLTTGVGTENAVFISDAPRGFVFKHGAEYNEYSAQTDINQNGKALMIMLLDSLGRTRVGIGKSDPKALVDATDDQLSTFELNPEHKEEASLNITNIEDDNNKEYIIYGLGSENKSNEGADDKKMVVFTSNAPGGYRFNQGLSHDDFVKDKQIDQGIANVVILADGKVGIGTEKPAVRLEVTDHEETGKFLFNLNDKAPNPAMSIINLRPDIGKVNYLAMGAGNKSSIFITNSEFGYSFRFGNDINDTNNDVEIEQKSEVMLSLRPEYIDSKKVIRSREMRIFPENTSELPAEVLISGIVGINKKPEEYELDVEGKTSALASYLVADRQKMTDINQIENALDRLNSANVKPVSFEWDPNYVENAPVGPQFGFEGQSLIEQFPELVRQTTQEDKDTDSFAVAYQNMVPVLVKAVQELSAEVKKLKSEIEELKGT